MRVCRYRPVVLCRRRFRARKCARCRYRTVMYGVLRHLLPVVCSRTCCTYVIMIAIVTVFGVRKIREVCGTSGIAVVWRIFPVLKYKHVSAQSKQRRRS